MADLESAIKKYQTKLSKNEVSKSEEVKPEIPLEDIKAYLHKKSNANEPLEIYYKDDATPRKMYNYRIADPYLKVKSSKWYYITYRIDRIRNVKK